MLLHIDGEVVEIRPSELFESKAAVESRCLEIIKEKKKVDKPPKEEKKNIFLEKKHGTSSGTES